MRGVPWTKFYSQIYSDICVGNTIVEILDEDLPEFNVKINSEWWDYNYNGKIQVD
jgi:hypothetical protein